MIVNTIVKLALANMPGPFRTYNLWPQAAKDVVHIEFLEIYRYREGEHVGHCRVVMEAICSKSYCEHLRRVRMDCIQEFGEDNTDEWKKAIPYWCKIPENWYGLCDIWSSSDWLQLSIQNKKNRGNAVTHYAGSRSAYKHHKELTREMKRDATCTELFLHIHTKKARVDNDKGKGKLPTNEEDNSGHDVDYPELEEPGTEDSSERATSELTFADSKSQHVYERFRQLEADPANADKPQELLWLMASGGQTRGRKYGLGSMLSKTDIATNTMRARAPTYSDSDASAGTGQQQFFTSQEVATMLDERDRRYAQERSQREQIEMERNNQTYLHIAQLYGCLGMQMPSLPGIPAVPGPPTCPINNANGVSRDSQAIHASEATCHIQTSQGDSANEAGQDTQTNLDGIQLELTRWLYQDSGQDSGYEPGLIFQ